MRDAVATTCPGKRQVPGRDDPVECDLDGGHDTGMCRYTERDGRESWFIPENPEDLGVLA